MRGCNIQITNQVKHIIVHKEPQISEKVKGLHFSIYRTKQTLLQLEKRLLVACIKEHGHLAFKCKGHLDSYGGPSHSFSKLWHGYEILKEIVFLLLLGL